MAAGCVAEKERGGVANGQPKKRFTVRRSKLPASQKKFWSFRTGSHVDDLGNVFGAALLQCAMSLLTHNVTKIEMTLNTTRERHFLTDSSALKILLFLIDKYDDSMAAMDAIQQAG